MMTTANGFLLNLVSQKYCVHQTFLYSWIQHIQKGLGRVLPACKKKNITKIIVPYLFHRLLLTVNMRSGPHKLTTIEIFYERPLYTVESILQVMWDDLIGEPEGVRSPDCTWNCSKAAFQVYFLCHVIHGGGWTLSQNVSSLALTVWDRQCFEDSEQKDHQLN